MIYVIIPVLIRSLAWWLVNASNTVIPDSVQRFLSLGRNFGLPLVGCDKRDKLYSVLETIKSIETNYHKLHPKVVDGIRNVTANSVHRFLKNNAHVSYFTRYILDEFAKCKKFFKNNDDVFVTHADKGQVTVILNQKNYIDKMNELLNDETTYKKLNKDPIKSLASKINCLVKA